jgi:mandelate racemase
VTSIRALRARAVDIPLDRPIETALATITTSPVVLIDLTAEDGVTGSSYVFCYTPLVMAPLVRLLHNLDEQLQGLPASPGETGLRLESLFRVLGTSGLVGMAVAGIDIALWDLAGKIAGVSLRRLLGSSRTSVPVYAGIRSMQPEDAAREAIAARERGFVAVKVKLGGRSLEDDLAVVRRVREAAGGDIEIMADYNQSLTVEEALRRGVVLDGEGLAWIEEPTRAGDDAGHARLAQALQTPIQLGENWWSPEEMGRSIAAGASDFATVDAVRIGGVSGWRRAASLAESAGLPVSSHRYPEVSASLLAATPTAQWLEYVDTVSPVLAEPIRVERGQVLVPDASGTGLEWNEDAVQSFLAG